MPVPVHSDIRLCQTHLFKNPTVGDAALTCELCGVGFPFTKFYKEVDTVGRMLLASNGGSSRRVPYRERLIKAFTAWAKANKKRNQVAHVTERLRALT